MCPSVDLKYTDVVFLDALEMYQDPHRSLGIRGNSGNISCAIIDTNCASDSIDRRRLYLVRLDNVRKLSELHAFQFFPYLISMFLKERVFDHAESLF